MKKKAKAAKAKTEESKYVQIVRMTARGKRTLYIPRASYEAAQKRQHHRFLGRVVVDGKVQALDPNHILFGPAHRDINPKATADWTPDNHKEYTKKWTK